jgi:hypothetical protein
VTDESTQFPEADRIVDEVLTGKRVFVFWPGTGTVVAIIMLHVLAMGLWWGPTLSACAAWLQSNVQNWQPLFVMALLVSTLAFAIPAALLVRGNAYGASAMLLTTRTWFLGATFMLAAAGLEWVQVPTWPYGIAAGLLALAYALAQTESFKIYVLLRRRFRVRSAQRGYPTAAGKR